MKYLFSLTFILCLVHAQAQDYTIGVIADFEQSPPVEAIVAQFIEEIDQTTGSSRKVGLGTATWGISDLDAAQSTYNQIQGQHDLILALGSVSVKGISGIGQLPTPVVGLGIIDPISQGIPFANGASGKVNFTYIWQTEALAEELEAFTQLDDFKNLAVFVDGKAGATIDPEATRKRVDSVSNALDAEINIIPVGQDINQVVSQLPAGTDAAYFTVMFSQSESNLRALIDQLNEQKIPTFTGSARLMDYGVLGSITNENDLDQVTRNLAIKSDEILSGGDLSVMPVRLETKKQFYLNLATARKIELPVPFDVLFTATLIGDEEEPANKYSFEEIIAKSLEVNLNVKISYQDLDRAGVDIKSARSNMLPQLESSLTGSQINEERANAAFNSPERSLSGNLTLSQVIYSEQAVAAIKITKYLQKAQEYNTEAEVLDVIFDTYSAYLNVLSAKTNVLIQRENLNNTKKNRELASIRVNIGSSNNADLYRWESELAFANQNVIDAQTTLLTAKLQLNTLLANTLGFEYEVEDVSLEDEWIKGFTTGPLAQMTSTPQSLQMVSDFLVEESLRENPNKKFILENINATDRQLKQNRRLRYIPTVAIQAQTSQILARGGQGSEIDAAAMAFGMTELVDNSWSAGFSVSYPIFQGFARNAAVQQSRINLDQLDNNRMLLDQNLELGVRASVLGLLSASTNIQFSNEASVSAKKNFELVQENYKQGTVNITQVIDAQQAALETNINAALSNYQYVQQHLQLEYNVGTFTMLMTEEELQDFINRLLQYSNN